LMVWRRLSPLCRTRSVRSFLARVCFGVSK
jgi:hypothetical protein